MTTTKAAEEQLKKLSEKDRRQIEEAQEMLGMENLIHAIQALEINGRRLAQPWQVVRVRDRGPRNGQVHEHPCLAVGDGPGERQELCPRQGTGDLRGLSRSGIARPLTALGHGSGIRSKVQKKKGPDGALSHRVRNNAY